MAADVFLAPSRRAIGRKQTGARVRPIRRIRGAEMDDRDDRQADETGGIPRAEDSYVANLVWFVGLLSTGYLVYLGLLLAFYSIAFMNYSTPDFDRDKAQYVAMCSMPLVLFAAIGFAGLRFWPHGRFRRWGLGAIACQTAMAVVTLANPGTIPVLDWFRWLR